MTDGTVRVWLVDRTLTEKPTLINHVYAVQGGDRYYLAERSVGGSTDEPAASAAIEVDEDELSPVEDDARREEFASQARQMAERHDPHETV